MHKTLKKTTDVYVLTLHNSIILKINKICWKKTWILLSSTIRDASTRPSTFEYMKCTKIKNTLPTCPNEGFVLEFDHWLGTPRLWLQKKRINTKFKVIDKKKKLQNSKLFQSIFFRKFGFAIDILLWSCNFVPNHIFGPFYIGNIHYCSESLVPRS